MADPEKLTLLLRSHESGGREEYRVSCDEDRTYLIGRDRRADLFINRPDVAPRHACIRHQNGGYLLEPLDMVRTTKLNGKSLQGAVAIAPGDLIHIGTKAFKVVQEDLVAMGAVTGLDFHGVPLPKAVTVEAPLPPPNPPPAMSRGPLNSPAVAPAEKHDDRTMMYTESSMVRHSVAHRIQIPDKALRIGRAEDAGYRIDDVMVSKYHTRVFKSDGKVYVEDVSSTNGTFVNGQRIFSPLELNAGDILSVGPHKLLFDGRMLSSVIETRGARISAVALSKKVRHIESGEPLWLLYDVNMSIAPGEFVVLAAPSGHGKSTFMDAISGRRLAGEGDVYYDSDNLAVTFEMLKGGIGYVPQHVIFHRDLPVRDALHYTARLRLTKDISGKELDGHVDQVLKTVGLEERASVPIRELSGGQQKRVALAMELLSQPRILFLDEVTSGLDLGTERRMMQLFRELADKGITVVCITHFVDSLDTCDLVAFFIAGRLVYYGPTKDIENYFNVSRISDLYDLQQNKTPAEWEAEYEKSDFYKTYVEKRLRDYGLSESQRKPKSRASDALDLANVKSSFANHARAMKRIARNPQQLLNILREPSDLKRQLLVLTRRNFQLFFLDRKTVGLLLGLPLAIAFLLITLTRPLDAPTEPLKNVTEAAELARNSAYFTTQITFCFGAILAMFFLGLFSSVREIVKELDIYRHEHFVNLQILPYVSSKAITLTVLGAGQAALILLALRTFGGWNIGDAISIFALLLLVDMAGIAMGLCISAAVPSSEWSVNCMIGIVIPQTLFAGLVVPLDGLSEVLAKDFVVCYWALDALKGMFPEMALPGEPMVMPSDWKFQAAVVALHVTAYFIGALYFMARKDGGSPIRRLLMGR
jgi:ABC-type multidrug transport system ATPase subunit/pSer/pThr/pTyr-binding forkhead associated (FHA) protein